MKGGVPEEANLMVFAFCLGLTLGCRAHEKCVPAGITEESLVGLTCDGTGLTNVLAEMGTSDAA